MIFNNFNNILEIMTFSDKLALIVICVIVILSVVCFLWNILHRE